MAFSKSQKTKTEIIKKATQLIWGKGYSEASIKTIAKELNMSTGNLTYYYPTKEHILAVLVDDLCKFQWKLIEEVVEDGISSVMAVCLELMTMASACESNPIVKDLLGLNSLFSVNTL